MKLYNFSFSDFGGSSFAVTANSKEEALESLKKELENRNEKPQSNGMSTQFEKWKDATLNNLPRGYSLEEYESGKVAEYPHE